MKSKILFLIVFSVLQFGFNEKKLNTACDFSLPNAFTPNGDGNNDSFCLQGWEGCVKKFSIQIFNRWGEEVFYSESTSFCWDGKFNGQILESGMYVFVINAKANDDSDIKKKGSISLIR